MLTGGWPLPGARPCCVSPRVPVHAQPLSPGARVAAPGQQRGSRREAERAPHLRRATAD